MKIKPKPVESLQISDFIANPVWEYLNEDHLGETAVRPIERVPVETSTGRVFGVQVQLATGFQIWATIGNVDANNPKSTEHFLTLSVEREGQWFHLSRYHDSNYAETGPDALARFLELPVNEVFPISYDIRPYVVGDPSALSGKVLKEPREKLTRADIIAMAVP
jgi:hypothetical protein